MSDVFESKKKSVFFGKAKLPFLVKSEDRRVNRYEYKKKRQLSIESCLFFLVRVMGVILYKCRYIGIFPCSLLPMCCQK